MGKHCSRSIYRTLQTCVLAKADAMLTLRWPCNCTRLVLRAYHHARSHGRTLFWLPGSFSLHLSKGRQELDTRIRCSRFETLCYVPLPANGPFFSRLRGPIRSPMAAGQSRSSSRGCPAAEVSVAGKCMAELSCPGNKFRSKYLTMTAAAACVRRPLFSQPPQSTPPPAHRADRPTPTRTRTTTYPFLPQSSRCRPPWWRRRCCSSSPPSRA